MRRLILIIGMLPLTAGLAACGPKKTRVTIPKSAPVRAASKPAPNKAAQDQGPPDKSELVGIASYYAEPYHGRKTASGEIFDTYNGMTAAHRTLPFDTLVRVTNEKNGLEVEVRINDRGPFIDGRVIDLSLAAARKIDMVRDGIVPVEIKILKPQTAATKKPEARPEAKPEAKPVSVAVVSPAPPSNSRVALPLPQYTVQVAAFESLEAADTLRQDLAMRYMDVSLQKTEAGLTFYRVRVGRTDEESAKRLADDLRKEHFEPYIVRVN